MIEKDNKITRAELLSDIIGTIDDNDIYDVTKLRQKYFEQDNKEEKSSAKVISLTKIINIGTKVVGIAAAVLVVGAIVVFINNITVDKSNSPLETAGHAFANSAKGEDNKIDAEIAEEVEAAAEQTAAADSFTNSEENFIFPESIQYKDVKYLICTPELLNEYIENVDVDLIDSTDLYIDETEDGLLILRLPDEYSENPYYESFIVLVEPDGMSKTIYVEETLENGSKPNSNK